MSIFMAPRIRHILWDFSAAKTPAGLFKQQFVYLKNIVNLVFNAELYDDIGYKAP